MNLERWPIARPKPYESNPRVIPEKAVDKVAASLKEFGWRQPIVVDRDGVILVGHTRLKAANKLGPKEVPVLIADDLTPEQARAYRIADNRTNEETSWLDDVLSLELKALDDLDFNLDLLGFDDRELMRLMTDPETDAAAEETPDIPANPVTVLGDVWVLGNHRIICGDSTSADVVAKLLGPVKPHLMVTDPPYGVEYDASFRDGIKRADGSIVGARAKGKVLNDDKADLREAWVLFPGEVAYVWHAGIYAGTVADSLTASGFDIRAQVIWAKNQFAIGRGHYHWQHEPCWYAVKGKGHWTGDRSQTTLWQIDKPQKSETGHSTQKPVECMRRPIANNSSPGQAIYEPFSGSGTTIIACEMTGRHAYAIELNPAYVDVAVLRWQQFSGKIAVHESDGRTFLEYAAERQPTTPVGTSEFKDDKPKGKAREATRKRA